MTDEFFGLTQTGWTGVAALATCAALLIAVAAVVFAWRQVKVAVHQLEENRKAQAEFDRPYVLVSIEPSPVSMVIYDLVVRNTGRRPAFDIRVALDPIPVRAIETDTEALADARMLKEPIALLPPGKEMRTFFDSVIERTRNPNLPPQHHVRVSYRDSERRQYTEESVVDFFALEGTLNTDVYGMHHAAKALREISKTMARSSALGRQGTATIEVVESPQVVATDSPKVVCRRSVQLRRTKPRRLRS